MSYYDEIHEYLKGYEEERKKTGENVVKLSHKSFNLRTFRVSFFTYVKLFVKVAGIQIINMAVVNGVIMALNISKERGMISIVVAIACFVANYICVWTVCNGLAYTLYRTKMSDGGFIMGVIVFDLFMSIGSQATINDFRISDDRNFMAMENLFMMGGILSLPVTVWLLKSAETGKQIEDIIKVGNSWQYLNSTESIEQILKDVEVLR